jgi:hypothetical protein
MDRSMLLILAVALVLAELPVYAQDVPSYGRLIIASTSRWGDGLSGTVKNLGPGKMCGVVVQANTFVEDNPLARADYGTTRVVTQDVGALEANHETSFHLGNVFVKGRMPTLFASGYPCR